MQKQLTAIIEREGDGYVGCICLASYNNHVYAAIWSIMAV